MAYERINKIIESDPSLEGYLPELVNRRGQNQVYKLRHPATDKPSYYAKFTADDDVWGPAITRMHREVLATDLVHRHTLIRVPESRIITSIQGQEECLVQEEIKGEPYDALIIREKNDRKLLEDLALQAGAMLAAIHQIKSSSYGEIDASSQDKYETWDECFSVEIQRILKLAREHGILDQDQETFFTHMLYQGCPRIFTKPVLCHRDFTPQNVIVSKQGNCVVGAIDFEIAQFWAGEWDVTRANAFLNYPPENRDLLSSFVEGYVGHSGADKKALLDTVDFYSHFESLYFWVWGWDKGFKGDIYKDIRRVISHG